MEGHTQILLNGSQIKKVTLNNNKKDDTNYFQYATAIALNNEWNLIR